VEASAVVGPRDDCQEPSEKVHETPEKVQKASETIATTREHLSRKVTGTSVEASTGGSSPSDTKCYRELKKHRPLEEMIDKCGDREPTVGRDDR